jgi:hypothetical protein
MDDEDGDDIHVACKMTSSASLASIVAALLFDKKDAVGTVTFNDAGIRIIVDRAKSIQVIIIYHEAFLTHL